MKIQFIAILMAAILTLTSVNIFASEVINYTVTPIETPTDWKENSALWKTFPGEEGSVLFCAFNRMTDASAEPIRKYTFTFDGKTITSEELTSAKFYKIGDIVFCPRGSQFEYKGSINEATIVKERYNDRLTDTGVQFITEGTKIYCGSDYDVKHEIYLNRQAGILSYTPTVEGDVFSAKGYITIPESEITYQPVYMSYSHDEEKIGWSNNNPKKKMTELPDAWYMVELQATTQGLIKMVKEENCLTISGDDIDWLLVTINPNPLERLSWDTEYVGRIYTEEQQLISLTKGQELKIILDKDGKDKKVVSYSIIQAEAK